MKHASEGSTPLVAVIGGANIDIHGKSQRALRSADSNPGSVHTSAGGVARNVAENLARLGVDARLVSAVGDDEHGRMLLRLSLEAGIDVQYVQEIAAAPTSIYLSVLDHTGEMHAAVADMSIMDQLGAERLQPLQSMLQQSSIIILDTNLPDDALAWLAANVADKPVFADTVSTRKAPRLAAYLSSIHTLKSSSIEVAALTGLDADTPAQLARIAHQLHTQGVERVFITRGAGGIFYSVDGEQGNQEPPGSGHDVQNAGGAGDAFLAALAYAWLEEMELAHSLRFALAAAHMTLSHSATCNPALSVAAVNRAMEVQHDA